MAATLLWLVAQRIEGAGCSREGGNGISVRLVERYLQALQLGPIIYEPHRNAPPDFVVDGRIAVEVRRLNQNHVQGATYEGLEQGAPPSCDGRKPSCPPTASLWMAAAGGSSFTSGGRWIGRKSSVTCQKPCERSTRLRARSAASEVNPTCEEIESAISSKACACAGCEPARA